MEKFNCEVLKDNFFKGKKKGDVIKLTKLEFKQFSKVKAVKAVKDVKKQKDETI